MLEGAYGERRPNWNGRWSSRYPSEHHVSGQAWKWTYRDCPHIGEDAQELHSNSNWRSSPSWTNTLRFNEGPHHLPRQISCAKIKKAPETRSWYRHWNTPNRVWYSNAIPPRHNHRKNCSNRCQPQTCKTHGNRVTRDGISSWRQRSRRSVIDNRRRKPWHECQIMYHLRKHSVSTTCSLDTIDGCSSEKKSKWCTRPSSYIAPFVKRNAITIQWRMACLSIKDRANHDAEFVIRFSGEK